MDWENFADKDLSLRMLVLLCGGLLLLAVLLWFVGKGETEVSILSRPEIGQGVENIELEIRIDDADQGEGSGEQSWVWQGELAARTYSEEELDEVMEQAIEEIREQLPRQGESLDRVITGVNLMKKVKESSVSVNWSWEDLKLLDREGNVCQEELALLEEDIILDLTAELSCQDRKELVVIPIRLVVGELTEAERYQRDLAAELNRQANLSQTEGSWELPASWEGKELTFYQEKEESWWMIPLLLMGVVLFYHAHRREEARTREKERKEQIIQQYPHFVSRFVVLLGAGMNLANVWRRLDGEEGALYEEVHQVVIRLGNGESERRVYEDFGRRADVQVCQRFASILTQNLRMGSERILEQLEYEATQAMEERKARARSLGEEMGTKLLMPMMLQLLLILALIMVPAFMNM